MSSSAFILFLLSLALANAQQVITVRRNNTRIIAGCVVGGVVLLSILLCLACLLSRRRVPRNSNMADPGGVGVVAVSRRPMFGSPWRRRRRGIIIIGGGGGGAASRQGEAPAQPLQQPPPDSYNTNTTGDAEKQADEKIVPASSGSVSPQPVEPPPLAHTKGEDDAFVGGFKAS